MWITAWGRALRKTSSAARLRRSVRCISIAEGLSRQRRTSMPTTWWPLVASSIASLCAMPPATPVMRTFIAPLR